MKHFSKLAATLAVVALIGAGCNNAAPTPPATPPAAIIPVGTSVSKPAEGTFTVHILPDGSFEPTSAFVKVGTKVTWVNDDNGEHQPRANPHPTHTDLPGFGPMKALKNGETYTYTFGSNFRLNYHDHLNPAFGGAVIVE